jgi:DNA polymerase-4
MAPAAAATILHADLDAFYASVEQLLDPSLRGTPIAVGGGVVLAASYEARAFGVTSGMSGWRARQLCPRLRFVGGHFAEYSRRGDRVVDIFADFTPAVERVSIDEAFLDVTGAVHLFGPPAEIAAAIRQRVRDEVGLPISVGVARTKHLAKVASQVAKPDGLVVVEPEREAEFLAPLPVRLIWGVGPVTRARLEAVGVQTIGELAATSRSSLEALLGRAVGTKLSTLAANVDARRVATAGRARSVSAQSAMGRRVADHTMIRTTLTYLADRVTARLRTAQRAGRTISVRVRFPGMRSVTRAVTVPVAVAATRTVADLATELALSALADHPEEREVSLLAIAVSNLVPDAGLQLELPFGLAGDDLRPGTVTGAARWAADRSIDAIRDRFGRAAIGYAGVHLGDGSTVPDEFRELAERDVT